MQYRASVSVTYIKQDAKTGETTVTPRRDLSFSIRVENPKEAIALAKETFLEKHGSTLAIRSCNMASRDQVLLYCSAKADIPKAHNLLQNKSFSKPMVSNSSARK